MLKANEISVLITSPVYNHLCKTPWMLSLFALMHAFDAAGIKHELRIAGDSLPARMRNNFASMLLHSEHTHLLCLDSDLEFEAKTILRMLEADKDIIGNAYSMRNIQWETVRDAARLGMSPEGLAEAAGAVVAHLDGPTSGKLGDPVPVRHVGLGMQLVKRMVFEQLRDANPQLRYKLDVNEHGRGDRTYAWDFYGSIIEPETEIYLSDDYSFCHRAKQLGIQTYMMADRTVHHGECGYIYNAEVLSQVYQRVARKSNG